MQNHGKEENAYLNDVITTFRDNRFAILKATYQPGLTKGASFLKFGQSTSIPAGGAGGGMGGATGGGYSQIVPMDEIKSPDLFTNNTRHKQKINPKSF